jgi:pilus assembly protein CpaB
MELTQKLISTRRGSMILAGAAAAIAGLLTLVYVGRYRESVRAQGTPVTVLIAKSSIPKGTPGSVVASKAMYSAATIRQSQLLEGAISDSSGLVGRAASRTIYPGQQLTAGDFATSATSLSSTLTDSQRVVTIPTDAAHGLVGQLQAGDRVDVFAGFNVVPVSSNGTPLAGGQARPMLRLMMQNIEVVYVSSTGGNVTQAGSSSVSLKVSDTQAAKLAFASDNGKIWLALRPPSGAKPSRPDAVTAETILLGIRPLTVVKAFGGH